MFAIYSTQGRVFRDKLEALTNIRKISGGVNTSINQDVIDRQIVVQSDDSYDDYVNDRNIATYRQMLDVNERSVIVHAYQIMSHPVVSIKSNMSVTQAFEYFQKVTFEQLPVMTPQMKLIGILTRSEVLQAYYQMKKGQIADLISEDVITADPVSDVRRVAKVLYHYKLPALPIVNEQDHMVGIVSKTDILKALMKDPPISLWT